MNPDGIAYLDIGDAYFQGDWANAINPVWPPLYSWLLGFVNWVVKPSISWEFSTVHIINLFIFIGTMVCFEIMWGKVVKKGEIKSGTRLISLPSWAWWSIGYGFFIWTSLNLIQIWSVTPDLLVAALLYLAAGILVDIRNGSRKWKSFISLGMILGFGYLAKTFMFYVGFVFLGLCLILVDRNWRAYVKVLTSTGIYILICIPFVLLISEKKGKFTVGEAGTITYIRYVNGKPFSHWQGDPSQNIILTHPVRVIHQNPSIYEFAEPVGGTYPLSTDPSYWIDGYKSELNIRNQITRILISGLFFIDLFIQKQGIVLACMLIFFLQRPKIIKTNSHKINQWLLVVPSVMAFGMYGLVFVSDRYIGAFVLLFWTDILANIRMENTENQEFRMTVLCGVVIFGLLANIFIVNLEGIQRLAIPTHSNIGEQTNTRPPSPVDAADMLQKLKIPKGSQVAVIGYGFDSFWARLARVKIIAELPESSAIEFWIADEPKRQKIMDVFSRAGARAVVAEYVPTYVRLEGWHQMADSNYYIYTFDREQSP